MSKKQHALDLIQDLIADYLYYDRKEDEDLNRADLNHLIESGELKLEEVVAEFTRYLSEVWEGQ